MRVLLLSTYELGHQPLGLARPAADLLAAGHEVRCLDLSVDPLDAALVAWAELVGLSVPMHTATRLGARVAERVRELNPRAHITFYGLYASLHADILIGRLGDSAIGGEYEGPLVALADALGAGGLCVPGVRTAGHDGGVHLGRQAFALPRRDLLPGLDRYAQIDLGTHQQLAGYVEASRGCAHRCLHCPITPVYGGRLRIVERDIILEDIAQLVRLGAEHITFGDPDFFNGIRHSLRIVEQLHEAFPGLTYDVTIKVEHLLEHRQHLQTLARTGCIFIVSAVEAVHDHVLAYLDKGHSAADIDTALTVAAEVGVPLRPTFVPFTPWLGLEQYLELLAFVRSRGLIGHIDPVQYAIRLLVPRGSSLYGTPGLAPFVGDFDPETFSYAWVHPDPRMDALQREIAALVEQAGCAGEAPERTFAAIERLALVAAGRDVLAPGAVLPADESPLPSPSQGRGTSTQSMFAPRSGGGEGFPELPRAAFVPRLTETWFC
jgi:radical SAM superfamily enzyme YgiQ (UPF0313 family)